MVLLKLSPVMGCLIKYLLLLLPIMKCFCHFFSSCRYFITTFFTCWVPHFLLIHSILKKNSLVLQIPAFTWAVQLLKRCICYLYTSKSIRHPGFATKEPSWLIWTVASSFLDLSDALVNILGNYVTHLIKPY
jgi:hypothetical protein